MQFYLKPAFLKVSHEMSRLMRGVGGSTEIPMSHESRVTWGG